jgi:hypothetical protein
VLRTALSLMVMLGIGLAMPDSARTQTDQDDPPARTAVSPDHVSEGLRRPALVIPEVPIQQPTFRSEVTEKLETPLDVIRRELQEEAKRHPWQSGYYLPGSTINSTPGLIGQVDVWPALVSLVTKIKTIRREHSEAEARQMVQQELAAFCSQHDCAQVAQAPLPEGVIFPQ